MTTENRSIEPLPSRELVKKWIEDWAGAQMKGIPSEECMEIAAQAAQWGFNQRGAVNEAELQKARDEELKACLEEIRDGAGRVYIGESKLRVCLADDIWTARRPKPKSQSEEALKALDDAMIGGFILTSSTAGQTIRAALERLRELENDK